MTTLVEAIAAPRVRSWRHGRSRVVLAAISAVAGSLVVAALAQVSIHLPFTPVPITGQTLGVLLVGASLGASLGAISLLLYLAEGALGLPFYAGGHHGLSYLGLASATGGYLWGFVLAAAVVGWLARRGWDRSIRSSIGAMFVGEVVLYATGIPWLMSALHVSLEKGLELGLYPFVIGDTVKLLLAAGLLPAAWRVVGRGRASSRR
jgi:biotin transport system substrate-specific component